MSGHGFHYEALSGTAPLRGRAGLDLRIAPCDYRSAQQLFGTDDLALATRLYSVIGGAAANARAGVALGRTTPGRLADYVGISGPRLDPILRSLVDAGFVRREIDRVRQRRPSSLPGDPLIRFHYAIMRPHQAGFARHGTDLESSWRSLAATYRSQVVGPAFEDMARDWVAHHADAEALGGSDR